jgi:hypothetical protein
MWYRPLRAVMWLGELALGVGVGSALMVPLDELHVALLQQAAPSSRWLIH